MEPTSKEALRALIAKGLTFADVIATFAESRTPEELAYVALADEQHGAEGECEIDDIAAVSESEEGAYVMAWVWVEKPDADES
jgi:hypothetical protein